jgi:hypothetical protein
MFLNSLGGALTSLMAFYLSGSGRLQDVLKGRPVTAISFASPQVGDNGYNKAFQALESKGDLQHIRISNQGDLIPVSPSFLDTLRLESIYICTVMWIWKSNIAT